MSARRLDHHREFVGSVCWCPTKKRRFKVSNMSYRVMRDGYVCPGCGLVVPVRVVGEAQL